MTDEEQDTEDVTGGRTGGRREDEGEMDGAPTPVAAPAQARTSAAPRTHAHPEPGSGRACDNAMTNAAAVEHHAAQVARCAHF